MAEEYYFGLVGRRKVEGATKKEFIINYLTAVYEQNKDLDNVGRMQVYVDYFVDNFSYDKDLRNRVIADSGVETFEKTEHNLFNLLYEGKGVCQQLSQALSLLSQIDYMKTKDALPLYYVATDIKLDGQDLAHAFNVIRKGNKVWYVIDISSMIHAKQGDYTQEKGAFYLRESREYCENMKKEGVEILTLIRQGLVCAFPFLQDTDEYYRIINEDKETMKKYCGAWLAFDNGEIENNDENANE